MTLPPLAFPPTPHLTATATALLVWSPWTWPGERCNWLEVKERTERCSADFCRLFSHSSKRSSIAGSETQQMSKDTRIKKQAIPGPPAERRTAWGEEEKEDEEEEEKREEEETTDE